MLDNDQRENGSCLSKSRRKSDRVCCDCGFIKLKEEKIVHSCCC